MGGGFGRGAGEESVGGRGWRWRVGTGGVVLGVRKVYTRLVCLLLVCVFLD